MYQIDERARGATSLVRSRYQQRLAGAWRRYREWERELNMPDLKWENRMAFEEWENFDRFSDVQKEIVYQTTVRQVLELVVKPELIGVAIRELVNFSDDRNHREQVGKFMDEIVNLGGAKTQIDGVSAVAKVNTNSRMFNPLKSHVGLNMENILP